MPTARRAAPAGDYSALEAVADARLGRETVHLAEVLNAAVHGVRPGPQPERQIAHRPGDGARARHALR